MTDGRSLQRRHCNDGTATTVTATTVTATMVTTTTVTATTALQRQAGSAASRSGHARTDEDGLRTQQDAGCSDGDVALVAPTFAPRVSYGISCVRRSIGARVISLFSI